MLNLSEIVKKTEETIRLPGALLSASQSPTTIFFRCFYADKKEKFLWKKACFHTKNA